MRIGVVTFPGSCDDRDARTAVASMGGDPVPLWHGDGDLRGVDAVVLPGGFSYGDYLRCGAIARFSPVMGAVAAFARSGGPVLGICNGFQVLCEAGLLPGALLRNAGLRFVCREVEIAVESTATAWTSACAPAGPCPSRSSTARAATSVTTPPPWPPPARSSSATPPATTPTAPWPTSPGSATRPATSSASCPTPSTPSTPSSAPPAAASCSSRS